MAHNAAMSACSQRWRLVLALFARLERPTRLSIHAALMACAAARRWGEALELLRDERELLLVNVALAACCERWPWALHLFQSLETPSAVTFDAVLRSFELSGRFAPEILLGLTTEGCRSLRALRNGEGFCKSSRFWPLTACNAVATALK